MRLLGAGFCKHSASCLGAHSQLIRISLPVPIMTCMVRDQRPPSAEVRTQAPRKQVTANPWFVDGSRVALGVRHSHSPFWATRNRRTSPRLCRNSDGRTAPRKSPTRLRETDEEIRERQQRNSTETTDGAAAMVR